MYLLDTNVISQLISTNPSTNVCLWIEAQDESSLFLSVITIGEIQQGITKLPSSQRRSSLSRWLEIDLLDRFRDRIIPIDSDIMLRWGTLVADLSMQGRTLPAIDSLIAATALKNNLTIVTRNTKDFVNTGTDLLNPWLPQA